MSDKTIPSLTAASSADGTELVHVVQSGNSRKMTLTQIMALKTLIARDEGSPLTTNMTGLDFIGSGVTATQSAGIVQVTIPGGAGIVVKDEGTAIATASSINFVGAGVTATSSGTEVTVTIPVSLSTNISAAADGQVLTYDNASSKWVNVYPQLRLVAALPGSVVSSSFVFLASLMCAGDVLRAGLTTGRGGMFASSLKCQVAPTANWTCIIKKNGSSIGTGTINAASTTGTFSFASDVTFAAGDILTVEGPAVADGTLSGPMITLVGDRKA
jgi:hypothetical protein